MHKVSTQILIKKTSHKQANISNITPQNTLKKVINRKEHCKLGLTLFYSQNSSLSPKRESTLLHEPYILVGLGIEQES